MSASRKQIVKPLLIGAMSAALVFSQVPAQAQSPAVVRGVAFVDANGNGRRDAGERSYFARYKVTNGGAFNVCHSTAGNGTYTFLFNQPGTYYIMPISGPGYYTPQPVIEVKAELGKEVVVDLPFVANPLAAAENCGPYAPKRAARVPFGLPDAIYANGLLTLARAIDAARLFDTLNTGGPFTVFAPSELAFGQIAEDDLAAILANRNLLTSILTYHVVPGRLTAGDVLSSGLLTTVNGEVLPVTVDEEGNVFVGDAQVIATDISAANGIIHIIDTVLVP